MAKDLNEYQIYLLRDLSITPLSYRDVSTKRGLWLLLNLSERLERIIDWETELVTEAFVTKEESELFPAIPTQQKSPDESLSFKISQKGRDYLSTWSVDKLGHRRLEDRIASLNATIERVKTEKSGMPIAQQKRIDKPVPASKKPTLAAYGIMHVYLKKHGGQPVTVNNQVNLAADYGYRAKSSGKQLYDEYNRFNNGIEDTPKTHLERLRSILPKLESLNPDAFKEVENNIENLQKKIDRNKPFL